MARLFRDLHTDEGDPPASWPSPRSGRSRTPRKICWPASGRGPTLARPEHFSRLLEVMDVLRKMIEAVRAVGDEPADVLVEAQAAALRAEAARLDGGPVALAAVPTVVPPAAPKPVPTKPSPLPQPRLRRGSFGSHGGAPGRGRDPGPFGRRLRGDGAGERGGPRSPHEPHG